MGNALFITVEGGEGCGKSSLLRHLERWLGAQGLPCLCTREPGGTPLAEALRSLLLAAPGIEIPVLSELLILLAARLDHVDRVVTPALRGGRHVLCDRYVDSTVAYQGYGREAGRDRVWSLCLDFVPLLPDLTFYLDVPVDVAFGRLTHRQQGARDRVESEAVHFHERVRDGFLAQARACPERIVILDASQSEQDVARDAAEILAQRLRRVDASGPYRPS